MWKVLPQDFVITQWIHGESGEPTGGYKLSSSGVLFAENKTQYLVGVGHYLYLFCSS